ncbi:MAG: hypothetical protein ABH880_02245 [Patescibacteria group bacterium]
MWPWVLILIVGTLGAALYGVAGFIAGLIGAFITFNVLGAIPNWFDVGLLRKRDRRLIASGFIREHKKEISDLHKENEWTADRLGRFINEIYSETNKLEDAVKRHPHDLGVAELRPNFSRGGKRWLQRFTDPEEKELMEGFVGFCEDVIYDHPERVGGPKVK